MVQDGLNWGNLHIFALSFGKISVFTPQAGTRNTEIKSRLVSLKLDPFLVVLCWIRRLYLAFLISKDFWKRIFMINSGCKMQVRQTACWSSLARQKFKILADLSLKSKIVTRTSTNVLKGDFCSIASCSLVQMLLAFWPDQSNSQQQSYLSKRIEVAKSEIPSLHDVFKC